MAGLGDRVAAGVAHLGGNLNARFGVPADYNDLGAAVGERAHHGATETVRAARHDDHFRVQVEEPPDVPSRRLDLSRFWHAIFRSLDRLWTQGRSEAGRRRR